MPKKSGVKKIKKGGYGTVYIDFENNKVVKKQVCKTGEQLQQFRDEALLLKYLYDICPTSFVDMTDFAVVGPKCYMTMDYFGGIGLEKKGKKSVTFDLRSLIEELSKTGKYIDDSDAYYIVASLLNGMICMHKKGVFHHDIKPDNIIYDSTSNTARYIDLGIACIPKTDKKCFVLTSISPPEIDSLIQSGTLIDNEDIETRLTDSDFWNKIDVYGLGITLKLLLHPDIFRRVYNYNAVWQAQSLRRSVFDPMIQVMIERDPTERFNSFEVYDVFRTIRVPDQTSTFVDSPPININNKTPPFASPSPIQKKPTFVWPLD